MQSSVKVLIIEDDKEIREMLIQQFQDAGAHAEGLDSGVDLVNRIDLLNPSILLLDQLMPGKSGLEILHEIRTNSSFSQLPIMMISALDSEADKLKAFEFGVDDYVTKPFSILEVLARAQVLVRRTHGLNHQSPEKKIVCGPISVDLMSHRVFLDAEEIKLTLTEFKILCELIRQTGLVLNRNQLRERALGSLNVSDRTIDVHMAAIRKKLNGVGDKIETVRGVGYRLAF